MVAGDRADTVGREKLTLVEHYFQDLAQTVSVDDGQQPALCLALSPHAGDVLSQIGPVLDEPFQTTLEAWQLLKHFRFERFDGEQWDKPHHRPNLHGEVIAV